MTKRKTHIVEITGLSAAGLGRDTKHMVVVAGSVTDAVIEAIAAFEHQTRFYQTHLTIDIRVANNTRRAPRRN